MVTFLITLQSTLFLTAFAAIQFLPSFLLSFFPSHFSPTLSPSPLPSFFRKYTLCIYYILEIMWGTGYISVNKTAQFMDLWSQYRRKQRSAIENSRMGRGCSSGRGGCRTSFRGVAEGARPHEWGAGREEAKSIPEQGRPWSWNKLGTLRDGQGMAPVWPGPTIKGGSLYLMQKTSGKSLEGVRQRGDIITILKDYTQDHMDNRLDQKDGEKGATLSKTNRD